MRRMLLLSGVLGALAGALEVTVRSPSLALHMGFGQGLLLAVAVMFVMSALSWAVALPLGLVVQQLAKATDVARRISIVLSLVAFFLGAFYFLPLADQARDNHGFDVGPWNGGSSIPNCRNRRQIIAVLFAT